MGRQRPQFPKAARDPNAPKRNLSTYLLYQNAMREEFKALNPGMTFGQLAKYTSAMYSELSPSEKAMWVQRSEADKARYLQELASYVPPPGYDPKGEALPNAALHGGLRYAGGGAYGSGGVLRKAKKPERDPNAPKRNMSTYLLYQNAMRDQFKRENPGMTFGQLAKYTSHMYKNLSPEKRAEWDDRAARDKARYDVEIAAYQPPPGHDARGVLIEERRPRKRNKRGPKDPAAPKRASGAYVFFTNEERPKLNAEHPGLKFVDLGKLLGQRWRALGPDDKKRFEEMADADKLRFRDEMKRYAAERAAAEPPQQQQEQLPFQQQASTETTANAPNLYYDPNAMAAAANMGYYHPQDPYGVAQQATQYHQA